MLLMLLVNSCSRGDRRIWIAGGAGGGGGTDHIVRMIHLMSRGGDRIVGVGSSP